MLAISKSIGQFVALANLEKDMFSQKSLKQDVEDLIDLITIRIKDKSANEVADSLLENVFNLRFELFDWLAKNDKDLNFYVNSLTEHLSDNLQLAPYSHLADTVSTVLSAYEIIVSPIFESISDSFHDSIRQMQKHRPDYSGFNFLSLHPSPQVKYLKNWIDSSLQFEVGIILADLIMTNQLDLPKKRIKIELIGFLYDTITRFGAYSIFTGFWSPEDKDVSNLTNRMKILAATVELDNKSFFKTSKDGFFRMVNN